MDGISTSSDTAGSYGTERQLQHHVNGVCRNRTRNSFTAHLRELQKCMAQAGMPCTDLSKPNNMDCGFHLPSKPFGFGEKEFILVPVGLEFSQLVIQLTKLGYSVRTSRGSLEVTSDRSSGERSYFAWLKCDEYSHHQSDGSFDPVFSPITLSEALIYLWGVAKEGTRNFFRSDKAVFCAGSRNRSGLSPLVYLTGGELRIELVEPDLLDWELRKRSLTQVHLLVAA